MSEWFKIVECPYCGIKKFVKILQKRCKCNNCKNYYTFK